MMSPKNPEYHPNAEQLAALQAARVHWGKRYKSKLNDCWTKSRYPSPLQDHQHLLQQVRNDGGPRFLLALKLPKQLKHS